MKEIKMDYSEYTQMLKLIEEQQKVIEEFKKDSRVILIDERYNHYTHGVIGVPKVIGNEILAKEYLQSEFDYLSGEFNNLRNHYYKLKEDIEVKEITKSSWLKGFRI